MDREHFLIGTLGLDQHENGAVAVRRMLEEAQMRVTYVGRFNTPDSIAQEAAEAGVDVIGISCHSWEYLDMVPELLEKLKERNDNRPVVIGGSVITASDAEKMKAMGVSAVFNGAPSDEDIIDTMRDLARSARHRQE